MSSKIFSLGVFLLLVNFSFAAVSIQMQLQQSGIHYEHVNNVQFTPTEWKLVTYVDLEKFLSQRPAITSEVLTNITRICESYASSDICASTINIPNLLVKDQNVEKYMNQFRYFMYDPTIREQNHVPAGFLDTIKRALFGKISFNETHLDNDRVHELIDTENKSGADALLIQSGLNPLHDELHYLSTLTRKSGEELEVVAANFTNLSQILDSVTALALNLERELDNYVTSLQTIIDAIYLAKAGVMHPQLITFEELENAVKRFISSNKNESFVFPMNIQDLNSDKLIKISKLNIGYVDGKLVVVIKVPLLDRKVFKMYKMYAFPVIQELGNNVTVSAYIDPRADYLLLTEGYYTTATAKDIETCIPADGTYICRLNSPIYNSSVNPICEVAIFMQQKNDLYNDCNIKISSLAKSFWASTKNGWMYSTPEEAIKIICDGGWQVNTTISKNGLLQLSPGCYVKTSYGLIKSYQPIIEESINFRKLEKLEISSLLPTLKYLHFLPQKYVDLNYYLSEITLYEYHDKVDYNNKLTSLTFVINIIFLMLLALIAQFIQRKNYYVVGLRSSTV